MKRYTQTSGALVETHDTLDGKPTGQWVEWKDVEVLLAELNLLRSERARTEALENEWLEDELMEVMRIVAKGMTDTHEDEIIYAMMVTAIRRLMEADTDKYEALFDRWQKRHAAVSPPLPKPSCTWRTGCTYEADCMAAGRCLGDRSPPQG